MSGHMGKKSAVQVKTAAEVQISAEQLLREAATRQSAEASAPQLRVVDEEELQDYRVKKRKDYEDGLRRQRHHIGTWVKYAQWEAAQKEFRRSRSIFERALNVDYENTSLWLRYIEMETKNKFINSARNLYDRVTTLLPRIDQFWFKYAHMEETLENYAGSRAIYEKWMEWEPEEKAWLMYVKYEERCGEIERARKIFERFLVKKPCEGSFIKFCKFEERSKNIPRARAGFEKAVEVLPAHMLTENFYIKFSEFERRQRNFPRAIAIAQDALKRLPRDEAENLYMRYISYQKQHGDLEDVEFAILEKRRIVYQEDLDANPFDYDTWFDLLRLEERTRNLERVRATYEAAVKHEPPLKQKAHWKRYIYLWINYAIYEELEQEDVERARNIYERVVELIPHSKFSFAKIWDMYATFELRRMNLEGARQIYARALEACGKDTLFKNYSELEMKLGNIDGCRAIAARFVEKQPVNPEAWLFFVDLEISTEELDRARALLDIAINIDEMYSPEKIWKKYIDMEKENEEMDKVRSLYQQLLAKAPHPKVYIAHAKFEVEHGGMDSVREVLKEADATLKGSPNDRADVLEFWLTLEASAPEKSDEWLGKVLAMQPKKVHRKQSIKRADGTHYGWEDVVTLVFPEDETQMTSALKLLEAARKWKSAAAST